jgi:uncharacterized damage-inducible protein DinB
LQLNLVKFDAKLLPSALTRTITLKVYQSLSDRLQSQHLSIQAIVENISIERKTIRPAIGKWNINDNIAHLVRYQIIFIGRLRLILQGETPHFERYKADDDPDFDMYRNMGETILLETLQNDRLALNELVANVKQRDATLTGVHPKFGQLNLVQWLEFFVLHEAHHIFTIFQLANNTDLQTQK